jgi:hypothetical protein
MVPSKWTAMKVATKVNESDGGDNRLCILIRMAAGELSVKVAKCSFVNHPAAACEAQILVYALYQRVCFRFEWIWSRCLLRALLNLNVRLAHSDLGFGRLVVVGWVNAGLLESIITTRAYYYKVKRNLGVSSTSPSVCSLYVSL